MYDVLPSFVLGFHGCDKQVAEQIFAGKSTLQPSVNDYDWLGHGVYLWENNPGRALDYAKFLKKNPNRSKSRISQPAVVGAVIDPGSCLNLLEANSIRLVKDSYHNLSKLHKQTGTSLPVNRQIAGSHDFPLRPLDCAVIEWLHTTREKEKLPPFDTVRGVFLEGEAIYPGAGINELDHIQVCVRNSRRIKGYFRVLK